MTPPSSSPSRRAVLATAATAAAGGTVPSADAAAASADERKRPRKTVVFRNVRPFGALRPVDLTVVDGRISDRPAPGGAHVIDGGGRIALPSLVDAHIHPDKTSWGGSWGSRRPADTIADYVVAQDVELFASQSRSVGERAYRLMAHAVTRGTRAMRAHADVAPAYGQAGLGRLVRHDA
jgi:cytosine/adenosine deaminase-related metal-dependent hydrolase